jgi:hypothetical protein
MDFLAVRLRLLNKVTNVTNKLSTDKHSSANEQLNKRQKGSAISCPDFAGEGIL